MSAPCLFCAIAAGTASAQVVMGNDRAIAFLDINPAGEGHALGIPRRHASDIWELEADDADEVWRSRSASRTGSARCSSPMDSRSSGPTAWWGGNTSSTSTRTWCPDGGATASPGRDRRFQAIHGTRGISALACGSADEPPDHPHGLQRSGPFARP